MENTNYSNNFGVMMQAAKDVLGECILSLTPDTSNIFSTMSVLLGIMQETLMDGYKQQLGEVSKAIRILLETISWQYPDSEEFLPCIPVQDEISESAKVALQYVKEEETDSHTQDVLTKIAEKSEKQITLADAIAILGLLVTILFGILQQLPNKQLETIVDQNNIQIAQSDELLDSLNEIANGINILAEKVDALREQSDNSDDPPKIDEELNPENAQEQENDA